MNRKCKNCNKMITISDNCNIGDKITCKNCNEEYVIDIQSHKYVIKSEKYDFLKCPICSKINKVAISHHEQDNNVTLSQSDQSNNFAKMKCQHCNEELFLYNIKTNPYTFYFGEHIFALSPYHMHTIYCPWCNQKHNYPVTDFNDSIIKNSTRKYSFFIPQDTPFQTIETCSSCSMKYHVYYNPYLFPTMILNNTKQTHIITVPIEYNSSFVSPSFNGLMEFVKNKPKLHYLTKKDLRQISISVLQEEMMIKLQLIVLD